MIDHLAEQYARTHGPRQRLLTAATVMTVAATGLVVAVTLFVTLEAVAALAVPDFRDLTGGR